jgi:hypothetical protein
MLGGFSLRTEDDEIGMAFGRLYEDFLSEEAGEDNRLHFYADGPKRLGESVQACLKAGLTLRRPQRPGRPHGWPLGVGCREGAALGSTHAERFWREVFGEFGGPAGDSSKSFEIDRDEKGFLNMESQPVRLRLAVPRCHRRPFSTTSGHWLCDRIAERSSCSSGVTCPSLLDLEEEDVAIAISEPALDLWV